MSPNTSSSPLPPSVEGVQEAKQPFEARFDELLRAVSDVSFDCGEWEGGYTAEYESLVEVWEAAEKALRDFVLTALAQSSADRERFDWLAHQHVEVRTPTRYGSRFAFAAYVGTSDEEGQWFDVPSDLLELVDAARLASPARSEEHA